MTEVPIRRGKFGVRHRQREECHRKTDTEDEGHVKAEAQTEVLLPQAKEAWATRAVGSEKGSQLKASEGAWRGSHPDFRSLTSRTVRQYISGILGTQFVALCYSSYRKLKPRLNHSSTIRNLHISLLGPGLSLCPLEDTLRTKFASTNFPLGFCLLNASLEPISKK